MKNLDEIYLINTGNRGIVGQENALHPYEATPYSFLHILFREVSLKKEDCFVDFGSGRGRLLFYVHERFGICVTGVEKNLQLHKDACNNQKILSKSMPKVKTHIQLKNISAEKYKVQCKDNVFYFFNPFSLKVFKKVIDNIKKSIIDYEREVTLIFYYPWKKYIEYLKETSFHFEREILIPGISSINNQERFLIFKNFS